MKRMLSVLLVLLSILLLAFVQPVAAGLLADFDTENRLTNFNSIYWVGADVNPSSWGQLTNANIKTEQAWLEAILGLVYNDPQVDFYTRITYPNDPEIKSLTNYFPGFNFDYAVVKYGNFWAAYGADDFEGLKVLNHNGFRNAISHVTYFNGTPVPEPKTMLLFGLGLLGLAGVGRRIKKA